MMVEQKHLRSQSLVQVALIGVSQGKHAGASDVLAIPQPNRMQHVQLIPLQCPSLECNKRAQVLILGGCQVALMRCQIFPPSSTFAEIIAVSDAQVATTFTPLFTKPIARIVPGKLMCFHLLFQICQCCHIAATP